MLRSLEVKNLALISEERVEFGPGLNILTGETGAGKSLLVDSVMLALGGKMPSGILRTGESAGAATLVFDMEDRIAERLREMELDPDGEEFILSRRFSDGKSSCRINGETVTARQVKAVSDGVIDLHGQHEHETLLHKAKHLDILDDYIGEKAGKMREEVSKAYAEWRDAKTALDNESGDSSSKAREQELARFELEEIERANLKSGEDEGLETLYKKMVNSQKIAEALNEACGYIDSGDGGASESTDHACRALRTVSKYDDELEGFAQRLSEIDSLMSDLSREMSGYLEDMEFDEKEFAETENRLNLINRLKDKYGRTIEDVLEYGEKQRAVLEKFEDYDSYIEGLKKAEETARKKLDKECAVLSELRKKTVPSFEKELKSVLESLNFLEVNFEVRSEECEPSSKGADDIEFYISTNPGESVKPLGEVASGGELSRIMLGIKTVMAGRDSSGTLIFDEIDAGISGKTAWKVAERLREAAKVHQVICITHLPQIAAMADHHFAIEKSTESGRTNTRVRELDEEERVREVARLLGSDEITESALENARELIRNRDKNI